MADNNELNNQTDAALENLKKLIDKFGSRTKTLLDRVSEVNDAVKEQVELSKKANKSEEEEIELKKKLDLRMSNLQKSYAEEYKKHVAETKKLYKQGEISEKERLDLNDNFREKFAAAIEDSDIKEQFKAVAASSERVALMQMNAQTSVDLFNRGLTTTVEKGIKPLAAAAGALISGYRAGGNEINLGSTILQAGLSTAGSAISKTGDVMSAAGSATSTLTKRMPYVGVGLQLVGGMASIAGKGLTELAQKGLPILTAELNKNIAAFQSMSSSGALFSNGLAGMIQVAGTAGMTLDMFNNAVRANSSTLAGLGEGVSAGATRAAKALQAGGEGMRRQLLNLGYSVEEQAGLVAETMLDMRQGAKSLVATDTEVAEQTKKYAENLRIIAGVTGEDAKKKMEQARQAAQDLAFQQQLQGMDAKQRQDVINAMANMNEVEKKAFQEMVVFGQVITPSLAATVTQSQNLQAKLGETFNQFSKNALSAESFQESSKQYNEGIRQDLLAARGVAQAGAAGVGGVIGDMYKSMNTVFQDVLKQSPEAIEAAQKAAREQKDTQDKQTDSMNKAITAQIKAAQEIQEKILDSGIMSAFATTVAEASTALAEMLNAFGKEKSQSTGSKVGSVLGGISAVGAGSVIGGTIGAAVGSVVPGAGTMVGGALGAAAGGYLGEVLAGESFKQVGSAIGDAVEKNVVGPLTNWFKGLPGFAGGGIINASSSGSPALLHGREMILPLPKNLEASALADLFASITDFKTKFSETVTADVTPNKITDYLASLTESQRQLATEQMVYGQAVTPDSQMLTVAMGEEITKAFANNVNEKALLTTNQSMAETMTQLNEKIDELIRATRDVVVNTDRTARGVA